MLLPFSFYSNFLVNYWAVLSHSHHGFIILHTLSQLKSGELAGIQRLKLSENLTSFPLEILSLADSLEILDLSTTN